MKYCKKCLLPQVAVNILFDDDGICNACHVQDYFNDLDLRFWNERRDKFIELSDWAKKKSGSNYNCIIPVSGGKDSYFQVETALQYGLNPLLVTYHGNNYLPEGQRNLDRMRDAFNVDHIVFGPSVKTLKRLNKICFELMGDMNWHAHAGIKIFPMIIATKFKIPLVLWGEITWSISGMFHPDDYVQYNKRTVYEHDMRGFTISDIAKADPNLTEKDLNWIQMPSDKDFEESETKGIYIGNFFKWDPNVHAYSVREKFGFEFAERPFERTYRTMSNLDDMHENGIHDYMKFVKFGYGRATDHSCKDIRTGYITREQGMEYVRSLDHVKPTKDLQRWLEYVDVDINYFDSVADSFRDPRVWWIEKENWFKQNAWGEPSSYGPVKLSEEMRKKYLHG